MLPAALVSRIILFFAMCLAFSDQSFAGSGTPFAGVACPNIKQLVNEMLESELSGQRFYAAKSECRDPKKFPHFRSSSSSYGEKPGTLGWYEAAHDKAFEIKKISELDGDTVQVEFEWRILDKKNPKKTKLIPDVLKFALYGGKTKDVVGCTGVLFAPAHIVVQQSCINFDKLQK